MCQIKLKVHTGTLCSCRIVPFMKDNRKCKNPTIYKSILGVHYEKHKPTIYKIIFVFVIQDVSIGIKGLISFWKMHRQTTKTFSSTNSRGRCCFIMPKMKENHFIKNQQLKPCNQQHIRVKEVCTFQ